MAGNPDPQIKALLTKIQEAGAPPLNTLTPTQAREAKNPAFIEFGGPPVDVSNVTDMNIPGPSGEIPIRVYTPEGKGPFPALVYFHGGGWVICNLNTHDSLCRHIVNRASCAVVSIDYRLAPEHKFPAAADDAYAATQWISENGSRIDVDPDRIAVGGDSAGGNLAAVVSLMAKDRGGPGLALQLLVYPVADLSAMDNATYRKYAQAYILTKDSMVYYGAHYLAREVDALNPYASPLLAEDLSGLPPALVITAELDVLTREGELYADRLREAGVPVKYSCYQGMIHAFFSMTGIVDRTMDAVEEAAAALREAFGMV
ncbi:MAG: alpha/beta hydrolase [Deltaproteobacteria bacterium]|nr:alpha/beta hydrolase [Deltaproteobacteria bacterium]